MEVERKKEKDYENKYNLIERSRVTVLACSFFLFVKGTSNRRCNCNGQNAGNFSSFFFFFLCHSATFSN